jgi:transcriptional regulator with XRE-family HTH domain
MGRAGKALKLVLEKYEISQNRLAVTMGTRRGSVNRWVKETRDPTAEAVYEIRKALLAIDPAAAEEFLRLYLDIPEEDEEQS